MRKRKRLRAFEATCFMLRAESFLTFLLLYFVARRANQLDGYEGKVNCSLQ